MNFTKCLGLVWLTGWTIAVAQAEIDEATRYLAMIILMAAAGIVLAMPLPPEKGEES